MWVTVLDGSDFRLVGTIYIWRDYGWLCSSGESSSVGMVNARVHYFSFYNQYNRDLKGRVKLGAIEVVFIMVQ